MDSSVPYRVRVRNILFFPLLTKHLFDKRSVQPAALHLETSKMERDLILDSRGMESIYNGIFIRDDVMVYITQMII